MSDAGLDIAIDALMDAISDSGERWAWDDEVFWSWAMRLSEGQAEHGPGAHRGPDRRVGPLHELPPTTTDLFRFAEVRAHSAERSLVARFRSSGTLAQFRASHGLVRTDVYDTSALTAFDRLVGSHFELKGLFSLVASYETSPESSLAYMVSLLARERFEGASLFGTGEGGLDEERLRRGWTAWLEAERGPVLLFATTLAARALLELDLNLDLPRGSLVLTTGGAKTLRRQLSAAGVETALAQRFPDAVVGAEYGMTELLSQAYRLGDQPFRLPPWCRVLAFDPASGERQPHGRTGLLRFIDLANAQSAITVQTADQGVTHSDHTFTLLGRSPGSQLRGCSLSFEELVDGVVHAG